MFVFGSSLSLVEARGLKRNASEVELLNEEAEDELLEVGDEQPPTDLLPKEMAAMVPPSSEAQRLHVLTHGASYLTCQMQTCLI